MALCVVLATARLPPHWPDSGRNGRPVQRDSPAMMLKEIDYPGPSFNASAALAAALAAAGFDPARSAAALIVATRAGPARAGHRDTIDFYPASVAKLPLLVAAHAWQEQGRLSPGAELDRALAAMIRESSNDATSYVIDCLTGTSSGPELPP